MKHFSATQKTSQTAADIAGLAASAGPNGIALAPPAYGLEVVDQGPILQKAAAASGVPQNTPASDSGPVPSIVHEVLRSPGQPLDAASRAFFEPRFGHDFSSVRIHTDAPAVESARAVNALAYTVGREVVFGAGQFAPRTDTGQRLLTHELAHVIQQNGNVAMPERISDPGEAAEQEAANIAATLTAQGHLQPVEHTSFGVALRQAETEGEARPQEKSPGFWGTIGGGLMGEFNENPTFAMIGVDTGVSLIPILDQASDVRDIVAHLYYMIFRGQYNHFMRWLGLVFTLIGLIPEVGSAIKSASKFIIKGVREVLSHLGDLLRPFRRLFPDIVDVNRLGRYIARNWNHWVTTGTAVWNRTVNRIMRIINAIPSFLQGRAQFLRDGIARIQELAPQKLQEAFASVRRQWDNIMERLGRREGTTGAETAEATAEARHTGRAEEAAEMTAEKASQLPRALAEAHGIAEANDLNNSSLPVVLAALMLLKTRFRWIKGFESRRRARGHYQIVMRASEHIIDPDYTPDIDPDYTPDEVMTETKAIENGLSILTEAQAARHLGIGMEKHHSFFRFLLRAFKKAKVIKKVPRHPRLEPLGPDLHQELIHQLWDSLHPRLARAEGASNQIADMLRKGEITPQGITNALINFYNRLIATTTDKFEKEALIRIRDVVRTLRKEMGV